MNVDQKPANIFEEILDKGHDEDFRPRPAAEPTTEFPGTTARLEALADRVQRGEELWHPDDVIDYEGGVGVVSPQKAGAERKYNFNIRN